MRQATAMNGQNKKEANKGSHFSWVVCVWIERLAVAVEKVRLPELVGQPFALASTEGAVQTASEEALHSGVTAGMRLSTARHLCPDLIVLPYDRSAYELAARPIWDALSVESSIVEPVEPELCYAQIQATASEALDRIAPLVRRMEKCLGAPVGAAIARTKCVALHTARHCREPLRLTLPGEEVSVLSSVPIATLAGSLFLQTKVCQTFARLGIKTLGDIGKLPPHRLPKSLQRVGYLLRQRLQGFDNDPVKALWPPRSLCEQVDFEGSEGINDLFLIERSLLALIQEIVVGLTAKREYAREMTLCAGLLDGSYLTVNERLGMPEASVPGLHRAGMRLFRRLAIEQSITSLAITVGDLGSGSGVQLSLMDATGELPQERQKRLQAALLHLRKRYGPQTVIPGAVLARSRRIHLWTFALGHLLSEPLKQVATDAEGNPVRYWRTRPLWRRYEVLAIYDRWRETTERSETSVDTDIWRVETEPFSIAEIRHWDTQWRLTAAWD